MSANASNKVVFAALGGNLLIAIMKFIAAAMTGSSAMLSEGIHSVVDSGNQVLLLYGMRRARRAPDAHHPFGYGMELYFWTFVVAILIFAIGAGLSIYEGIHRIQNPAPLSNPTWNYVVLLISMVIEGIAWSVAFREFNKVRGSGSAIRAIRKSKDPVVFTVLFEDSAAMLGLAIALAGVAGSHLLGMTVLDGIASVGIGLLLAAVAILLAVESKGLLIGEGADPATVREIRRLFANDPRISHTNEILTMHFGPTDILLTASFDFVNNLSADEVEAAISEFETRIKTQHPAIKRVFIEAQSWRAHADSVAAQSGE